MKNKFKVLRYLVTFAGVTISRKSFAGMGPEIDETYVHFFHPINHLNALNKFSQVSSCS